VGLRLKQGGPSLKPLGISQAQGTAFDLRQEPRARARLTQMGGAQPFRGPDLGARNRGQSAPPALFWGQGGRRVYFPYLNWRIWFVNGAPVVIGNGARENLKKKKGTRRWA
jgi:hypothetical protein